MCVSCVRSKPQQARPAASRSWNACRCHVCEALLDVRDHGGDLSIIEHGLVRGHGCLLTASTITHGGGELFGRLGGERTARLREVEPGDAAVAATIAAVAADA